LDCDFNVADHDCDATHHSGVGKFYGDRVSDGPFVSKAGDFMTGPLQLPGEKSEIRRGVYDRIVNAVITVAISAAIAMHDRWSFNDACRAFQAGFLILQFSVPSSQFLVLSGSATSNEQFIRRKSMDLLSKLLQGMSFCLRL
jgi:hypothetical protein